MRRVAETRNPVIDKFGTGKHGFTGGNPQTGTPATTPGFEWFDSIQEELANVLEENGVTLDPVNNKQLAGLLTGFAQQKNAVMVYPSVPAEKKGDIIYIAGQGLMKWNTDINNYLIVIQTSFQNGVVLEWVSENSIKVNTGAVRDSTNHYDIVLTAPVTETLTSTANNAWYHAFVCTNGVDQKVFFDSNLTPTLPAGYHVYKRLGSVKTDSNGVILKFSQHGKTFVFDMPIREIVIINNQANINACDGKTYTVSSPPNLPVKLRTSILLTGNEPRIHLRDPSQPAVNIGRIASQWSNYVAGQGVTFTGMEGVMTYSEVALKNNAVALDVSLAASDATIPPYFILSTISYEEI